MSRPPQVMARFDAPGGRLAVGGLPVDDIVAKTGTPVYLYDAAIMREQYRRLAAATPAAVRVHFSLKANPHPAIASLFAAEGGGAEVASLVELKNALAAGFAPSDILFAGPGKSDEELAFAVRAGIGSINIESATELARVRKLAAGRRGEKPVRIAFRVNLDMDVTSPTGRVMVGGPRKFGVDDTALTPLVVEALADPNVEPVGFHCFAGTQITDATILAQVYDTFADWARRFAARCGMERVATLNFGGGLGVPFADDEKPLDVEKIGAAFTRIARRLAKDPRFVDARLLLEPGRYLAGPGGIYVCRVIDIKESRGRRYVITDGGIHHALVPIVMNKSYPSALVNKMDRPRRFACTVAGPLCSSADQFSREVKLAAPAVGDLLGIFNSGAYGFTAGMSYFLSHPIAAEVLVDAGKALLLRRRASPLYPPARPL